MMGVGIKNIILFVLIILILHFLVKNAILEKKRDGKEHLKPENDVSDTTIKTTKTEPLCNNNSAQLPKTVEEQKKELFQYVMDEAEIEKFFEPQLLPEPNDKFENEYSIACDARNAVKDPSVSDWKKKTKDPPNQSNNYLVIHEYSDESGLNGGKLPGGLDGYDGYDNLFQDYKCGL